MDNKSQFVVGLNVDSSSDDIEIDDFIEKRIKTDFMSVKGYPIYRVSNFRFAENQPSIYRFLNTLISKA